MTTSTFTGSLATDHDRARRAIVPAGAAAFVVAAALSISGANDTAEWLVELAVQAVASVLLFGLAVPKGLRHESAGGRALAMAVVAALLVLPAFWLGLTPLLATAAVLLGYAGKSASSRAGLAAAALVLGTLSIVAYLAVYVGDYVNTHV